MLDSSGLAFHHIGVACRNFDSEEQKFAMLGYRREGQDFHDPQQGIHGRFLIGAGPTTPSPAYSRRGSPKASASTTSRMRRPISMLRRCVWKLSERNASSSPFRPLPSMAGTFAF
jgi:hypothetical protein